MMSITVKETHPLKQHQKYKVFKIIQRMVNKFMILVVTVEREMMNIIKRSDSGNSRESYRRVYEMTRQNKEMEFSSMPICGTKDSIFTLRQLQ